MFGCHQINPQVMDTMYSGHYTTSVNVCEKTFYCNNSKITEYEMINTKNSTANVVIQSP